MTNSKGRFGVHGGQYIPETLMNAVIELEEACGQYKGILPFRLSLRTCSTSTLAVKQAVLRREDDRRFGRCQNLFKA
ncbi:MAG: hypothetical protein ACLR23_28635 [Clostridia bacterium]